MPVDLTFVGTRTIVERDGFVEVRLPVTFGETIRQSSRGRANINITPDGTDPIYNMAYDFIRQSSVDQILLYIPEGYEGTMTIAGQGTVFRTDTGDYDTINTGIAVLAYDTRLPEITYRKAAASYVSGDNHDFIVGFNRFITLKVPDPSDGNAVFVFDGANLGADPQVWGYSGAGVPTLPLPDDLDMDKDWTLVVTDTFYQYFAVRFPSVPNAAQGAVNIYPRGDILETSNTPYLLSVTAPVTPPQPQMQDIPVIERIDTQFLELTEDFSVDIAITGGTATSASVRGLAVGSEYDFDETNQMITITGNANKLLTDATWVCNASGAGGDAATVNQTYNYVELAPVVTQLTKQTIYTDDYNEIIVPIDNIPSDGTVTMELVGMEHQIWDDDGDGQNDSMRIWGTPSGRKNYSITEGRADIMVTNTGGDASGFFEFDLEQGTPVFVFREDTDDVYKIVTDGSLAWTYTELPTSIYDPILVASDSSGIFLFAEIVGYPLYKILTADGTLAWTKEDLPSTTYFDPVASSDGGVFFFREDTDDIIKVSPDGSTAWTYTGLPTGQYSSVLAATSDGGIVVRRINAGNANYFYKIDADGTLAWTNTSYNTFASLRTFVASSDGGILVVYRVGDDVLRKIDADGSNAWDYTDLTNFSNSPHQWGATSDGGAYIVVFDSGGTAYKIGSDGAEAWEYDSLSIANHRVFASSDGGIFIDESDRTFIKLASDGTLAFSKTIPNIRWTDMVAGSDGDAFLYRSDTDDILRVGSDGNTEWTNTDLPIGTYEIATVPIIFLGG